jgi:hypothetical protein
MQQPPGLANRVRKLREARQRQQHERKKQVKQGGSSSGPGLHGHSAVGESPDDSKSSKRWEVVRQTAFGPGGHPVSRRYPLHLRPPPCSHPAPPSHHHHTFHIPPPPPHSTLRSWIQTTTTCSYCPTPTTPPSHHTPPHQPPIHLHQQQPTPSRSWTVTKTVSCR